MVNGKTSFTVTTKPSKDGVEKSTVLTINWDGITDAQLQAGYTSYLTIKRQGFWRKNGIPANETVNAKDFAPGSRQPSVPPTVEGIKAAAANFSPEDRAALLKLLQS